MIDEGLFTATTNGEKGKGALWGPFYKGTDPIYDGFDLMTQSPPKGCTSYTITLQVRISIYEFLETYTFIQSIAEIQFDVVLLILWADLLHYLKDFKFLSLKAH